jgi:hypothetical protein
MPKEEPIVRYSLEQIREAIARGEDKTDWSVVDRKSEADLEADIASDPDAELGEFAETWVRVPPGYEVRLVKKNLAGQ